MQPQISMIKNAVAEHFGVALGVMESSIRTREQAEPRMVAMALCRRLTSQSLLMIGKQFRRDHTTVLNAERRVSKLPHLKEASDAVAGKLAAEQIIADGSVQVGGDWRRNFYSQLCTSIAIGEALMELRP